MKSFFIKFLDIFWFLLLWCGAGSIFTGIFLFRSYTGILTIIGLVLLFISQVLAVLNKTLEPKETSQPYDNFIEKQKKIRDIFSRGGNKE